jgi:hypothetical protein
MQEHEQITPECLSLGDETDLSQPDYPLLRSATVQLSPAGDSIQISTQEPVDRPGVSVVLRIQCPGEPLTARHFNLLLRHPGDPPAPEQPMSGLAYPAVTRLTLLHNETVSSIARAVHPHDAAARKELEKAIITANPKLFPRGRAVPLSAGTRLLLPLPAEAVRTKPLEAVAKPRPQASSRADGEQVVQTPPKRERPQKLRLRMARGDLRLARSEGWTESRREELRRLYRGEAPVVVATSSSALELKIAQLREAQNAINSHLARLEQLLESLRRSITALLNAPPVRAPAPSPNVPPPPPVRQPAPAARINWTMWAAIAGGALLLAAVAFLIGRKSKSAAVLAEHEARIDSLLHEARQAAGPLLAPPPPEVFRRTPPAPARPAATAPSSPPTRAQTPVAPPPPPAEPVEPSVPPELSVPPLPDLMLDTQTSLPANGVDVELEAGGRVEPPPAGEPPAQEPKVQLKQEMDMAIDNSRSMFTDVDRFIALGRIQNAISLLEFQTQRDPRDRDSWVKLMAVYRQEGMETEFQRTYALFKRQFPEEV